MDVHVVHLVLVVFVVKDIFKSRFKIKELQKLQSLVVDVVIHILSVININKQLDILKRVIVVVAVLLYLFLIKIIMKFIGYKDNVVVVDQKHGM